MKQFNDARVILDLLKRANDSYYNNAESIISDSEYDTKKDQLRDLYEKVLLPKKSVDQELVKEIEEFMIQVGAPVTASEWRKQIHKKQMTSLNKVNTEQEFKNWVSSINGSSFVIFDKMDGGSIDLVYSDSKLVQAITRGDGIEGEDIFQNVLKMKNVKSEIKGFSGNLKGEIVIVREDFETLNEISERTYKNPRNTATGLSKSLDGVNVDLLSIYFYDIDDDNKEFETEEEKMLQIESYSLKTCFWEKVNIQEAIEIFNQYESSIRASLNYDIDGLVIRENSISLQEQQGELGGNPKAKIAWKFKPLQAKSKITYIEWHLGNSGRITPIIHVEPTPIGGITVQKMTGFNLDFFLNLKPYKDAILLFERANDTVPIPLKIVE